MALQEKMKAKLEKAGIPHKEIRVYGNQIVVTAWGEGAARKWASVIARFARIRAVIRSIDYDKKNTNTVMLPSTHEVWRVFAAI